MPPSPRPEHVLAAVLALTEEGVLSFDLDGAIQTWSRGAERLYGYAEQEITGQALARLLPLYEVPSHAQLLSAVKCGKFLCCEAVDRVHKDGSRMRVALRRAAAYDEHGEVSAIVETARVLGRNATGSATDEQLRLLLEQMPAVLWTTDANLRITSNWGALPGANATKPNEFVGRTVHEYLKCQDLHAAPMAQHVEALHGSSAHFEYHHRNRDFEIRLAPLCGADGAIIGCIGAGIDITERKRCEQQIHYQATHDALTGLANYREFVDTLEREVRRADRSNRPFAVLLLDLDDLKRVNDRFGHLAGNRALQELAEAMKEHCRSTDLASRYGGDEFAVLLIDADGAMARQIAERVESALRKRCAHPPLSVSIGISVYPEDGRTSQDLLEAADQHLYKRKKKSHSHSVAG
jgi:diguanylate cyclase (GGDEF)-like protein/PAS domain S-box-containing protein